MSLNRKEIECAVLQYIQPVLAGLTSPVVFRNIKPFLRDDQGGKGIVVYRTASNSLIVAEDSLATAEPVHEHLLVPKQQ